MLKNLLNSAINQVSKILNNSSGNGMGCYYHSEEQAIAQCKKCGKGICKDCFDRYTEKGEQYTGLCRDCVLKEGINCSHHSSKQAVVLCERCGEGVCKDCSDVTGSWCSECIKEMEDTNTGNTFAKRSAIKKEWITMTVFSGIGFLVGLFAGIDSGGSMGALLGLWIGTGIGGGFGYFIFGISFGFKLSLREGKSIGEALKDVLLGGVFFILLGGAAGPIFSLFTILRRVSWMKKCSRIIANEEKTLISLAAYLDKGDKTADLNENVRKIVDNYSIAYEGVSINDIKIMKE